MSPKYELCRIWIWYLAVSEMIHQSSPWKIVSSFNQLLRNQLNNIIITATKKERIHRIFIHRRWRLIIRDIIHYKSIPQCKSLMNLEETSNQRIKGGKENRKIKNVLMFWYHVKNKKISRTKKISRETERTLEWEIASLLLKLSKWKSELHNYKLWYLYYIPEEEEKGKKAGKL